MTARIVAGADIRDEIAAAVGNAGIRRLEAEGPDLEDIFLSYYHGEATT
jgi:ABC-2 type transport system ATP-binding protein